MKTRRVIRYVLTLYLWGFVLYQILPIRLVPYTNYSPQIFYPKPFLHAYTFAYGVRTSFSNHAGSVRNLLSAMERKGFDLAFGDFPQSLWKRLFPEPEVGCWIIEGAEPYRPESVLHTLLEVIPGRLAGAEPSDVLTRRGSVAPADCYLVAHRGRVLLSTFLGLEIPSYDTLFGSRKNVSFLRDPLGDDPEKLLRGAIVKFGDVEVRAFGYSERSFYLPGEETRYPFRYVVEVDTERPLILMYRDDELVGIFTQRRISYPVERRGSYTALVKSYRFRIGIFYFGLRTLAVVSPIRLI